MLLCRGFMRGRAGYVLAAIVLVAVLVYLYYLHDALESHMQAQGRALHAMRAELSMQLDARVRELRAEYSHQLHRQQQQQHPLLKHPLGGYGMGPSSSWNNGLGGANFVELVLRREGNADDDADDDAVVLFDIQEEEEAEKGKEEEEEKKDTANITTANITTANITTTTTPVAAVESEPDSVAEKIVGDGDDADLENNSDLSKMKYSDVKKLAATMGLENKGTKEAIIRAIVAARTPKA